jgi:hypothetical protein
VAVKAALVKKERLSLDVGTQLGDRLGQILEAEGTPNTEVCLEVDTNGFLDLFLSRLG